MTKDELLSLCEYLHTMLANGLVVDEARKHGSALFMYRGTRIKVWLDEMAKFPCVIITHPNTQTVFHLKDNIADVYRFIAELHAVTPIDPTPSCQV